MRNRVLVAGGYSTTLAALAAVSGAGATVAVVDDPDMGHDLMKAMDTPIQPARVPSYALAPIAAGSIAEANRRTGADHQHSREAARRNRQEARRAAKANS